MTGVTISLACTGCGACLATCPERALLRAPRRPLVVADRCTACLACVEVCPVDAISEGPGYRVSPKVSAA
ncbi:MAG TPA: 4Fe-4S binding protein [Acidimicrobiia bacterium]